MVMLNRHIRGECLRRLNSVKLGENSMPIDHVVLIKITNSHRERQQQFRLQFAMYLIIAEKAEMPSDLWPQTKF